MVGMSVFLESVGAATLVVLVAACVVIPMTVAFPLRAPALVGIRPTIIGAPPVGDWLTKRVPAVAVAPATGVDCVCAEQKNVIWGYRSVYQMLV